MALPNRDHLIERLAQNIRYAVRKRAGLKGDWDKADDNMKAFYRRRAKQILDAKL